MGRYSGKYESMEDEKLAKRADAQKIGGEGRRERPRLRWEDCVTRGLERVGRNGEQQQKIQGSG